MEHTQLDKIWVNWLTTRESGIHAYRDQHYINVPRRTPMPQLFESWLYSQGAIVVQKNHKRFIDFISEEDAIVFKLKYG